MLYKGEKRRERAGYITRDVNAYLICLPFTIAFVTEGYINSPSATSPTHPHATLYLHCHRSSCSCIYFVYRSLSNNIDDFINAYIINNLFLVRIALLSLRLFCILYSDPPFSSVIIRTTQPNFEWLLIFIIYA